MQIPSSDSFIRYLLVISSHVFNVQVQPHRTCCFCHVFCINIRVQSCMNIQNFRNITNLMINMASSCCGAGGQTVISEGSCGLEAR
jgi:hypothetical protein